MMCIFNFLRDYKDAFTSISAIFAVVIFGFGVFQYRRAERWKRTEFVAKLYSEFANDYGAIRTGWMLDGDSKKISFREGGKEEQYTVHSKDTVNALRAYSEGDEFSLLDLHIRDCFDRFFVFVEQFERAIQNGLVDKRDVYPYFVYWIDRLNEAAVDPGEEQLRKSALEYVEDIGYDDVLRFLARWQNKK